FIHLTLPTPCLYGKHKRKSDDVKKIVLIGKGVTFDSGGYNLKTGAGSSIERMKYDMAGAAAVLGTFASLKRIFNYVGQSNNSRKREYKEGGIFFFFKNLIYDLNPYSTSCAITKGSEDAPAYEIHGCIAACENLISGNSQVNRPGDIIVAADGTTIEVNNTDAEGRLTLADAIWYAKNIIGADVIVDVATLTGAIKIALGPQIAGLFSTSDALANTLLQCSQQSGEPLWRQPLYTVYKDMLKSDIADLKNSSTTGFAGSITAGLFLQRFVENKCTLDPFKKKENPQWAHIDLAGPVWSDNKRTELSAGGATGYGVRLLTKYVLSQCVTCNSLLS
ncbi:Cytosol aminopeptidase, partial [Reticulomyxa filosa]